MGRERKAAGYGTGPGDHAKERHKRTVRNKMGAGITVGRAVSVPHTRILNPRPEVPSLKSKHQSYYELVENKDKKKKLDFEITSNREPPPGFEFVPIGNPELTTACKEISREQDAMIFIVSTNKSISDSLAHHVSRIGHHIRQTIVEQARETIGESSDDSARSQMLTGHPEPIPATQQEINEQADKAIRDLFPRIPNTDRQMIIEHSFKKGAHKKRGPLVGLAQDITLSRRVQLAVLAHIRHTHTRYDQLLRETSYINARRAVETLCLDILVKWRGDEETGRDQLDEILREVIVISDSEEEDDDGDHDNTDEDDEEEEDSSAVESGDAAGRPTSRESSYSPPPATTPILLRRAPERELYQPLQIHPAPAYISTPVYSKEQRGARRSSRGFDRYQAALEARWGEAMVRVHRRVEAPSETVVANAYPVPRREASQGGYQPSVGDAPHHDSQSFPGRQMDSRHGDSSHGHGRGALHPVATYVDNVQPTSSNRHVLPVYAYEKARQPNTVRVSSDNYRSYTSSDHPVTAQRRTVSSEQARDYLVPSIEPLEPSARQQSLSQRFEQRASPYYPAPYATENPLDQALRHTNKRHSPTWTSDEHASTKRRRHLGGEPDSYRASPHQEAYSHLRPVREERDTPSSRAYVADHMHANASQSFSHGAPPPGLQPLPVGPPSVSHGRSHVDAGLALRGDQFRPIVVEDWAHRESPIPTSFPIQNYREESVPQRRAERVSETRHEPSRPFMVEHQRTVSMEYPTLRRSEKDHFARYRAVHESSLPGTQNQPPHTMESRPFNYRYSSHPPPSHPQPSPHVVHHNADPQPVPQLMREAIQPFPRSDRQLSEYGHDMAFRRVGEPSTFGTTSHDRTEYRPSPNGLPPDAPVYNQYPNSYLDGYSQPSPDNNTTRGYYGHSAPRP